LKTNKHLYLLITLIFGLYGGTAQKNTPRFDLFENQEILSLKLQYANKQVKKETDKKNGIKTDLIYRYNATWDTIPISLRARGNFRRASCYFPPLKMYLEKDVAAKTMFEGHKQLKVVLPCLLQNRSNDDILKEYLAYKIYELISPIHFKTRLVTLKYLDTRGEKSEIHPLAAFLPEDLSTELYDENEEAFAFKKPKEYQLKAILIEDEKIVAKRHGAKVMKRFVHPLNQEETASVTNAFFQFMIGNTDFSTAYRHNQKLLFINKKIVPLPYDFDMSGLVDASYAVVSNINNTQLDITEVTDRKYRGFKRELSTLQEVRRLYLDKKPEIMKLINDHSTYFEDTRQFQKAQNYIANFFEIIGADAKFTSQIVKEARVK